MNKIQVKVIKDSVNLNGDRITTIHARYPRIIHSEVMTHRAFSRNARSSRAVPVKTMLEEIKNDPFVPWHWGKNIPGMQAKEEHNEKVDVCWNSPILKTPMTREEAWLDARDHAVRSAESFMDAGYHKQVANRLLEPFMYIDTLITSTSWANFFHLREHEDAEPHFYDLASSIHSAINESSPGLLKHSWEQWHLPYVTEEDYDFVREYLNFTGFGPAELEEIQQILLQLSVARCARISYKPFDGDASIAKEIERYEKLVGSDPLHASPAEHQATPDKFEFGNATSKYLHGNFKGWIQYRKTLDNEYVRD